jgi:hypothetical protein
MFRLRWIGVVIALLSAGAARADQLAPNPTPPDQPQWYGNQILIADGAGAVILLLGVASTGAWPPSSSSAAPVVAGFAVYVLVSPVIHVAHQQWFSAGTSFALRLVVVPAAVLAGSAIAANACGRNTVENGEPIGCEHNGAIAGLVVSLVAISIFDIVRAWSATADSGSARAPTKHETGPTPDHGLAFAPYVTPNGPGLTAGLVGRF